uniref:Uncharacterized protein n=1 Tax=Klebsiella pneumoniae TaxID=573 RepID=A0A8B0STU1_KLEPN|nr:hypothetical protein [Klebsiella pneumoniae]
MLFATLTVNANAAFNPPHRIDLSPKMYPKRLKKRMFN